ncbi:MAG: PEP/pyruvate-binding domain-containing protein [Planctomycetota bacterium]
MTNQPRLLTEHDAPDRTSMGGKGAALVALIRAGFRVPPLVIVPPAAFDGWSHGDSGREVANTWIEALNQTLTQMEANPTARWAVRSSAVDEDGTEHAFAGQLDSYLDVEPSDVAARVVDVWRSGQSERVRAYRAEHALSDADTAPAVIVQQMLQPKAAGVAFSADPVSGRRGLAVVSAAHGVGDRLVSGEVDGHTWWIDRSDTVEQRDGDATGRSGSDDDGSPITNTEAIAVASLARRCATHFGRPQDIEWAFVDDTLYLLQSRPITGLRGRPDPDAPALLWDNSNIAESYSGVTSALTFSFARHAYEHVYREFCRVLRVPRRTVDANDQVFTHMLGRVRGRVYYNLLNWYRLLTMLPGFQANRGFMEQMMGVREGLPDAVALSLVDTSWATRMIDRLLLSRSAVALVAQHLALPRTIRRFNERLDRVLSAPDPPLERRRLDELAADYRQLEANLIRHWDAPLINDFLAMIFFGTLGKLAAAWCADEHGSLHNDLLVGEGGIISSEPARRVAEMGAAAANDAELTRSLQEDPPHAVRRTLGGHHDVDAAVADYLARFGDRCLEELKLESATLDDDPTPLFRSIGAVAASIRRRGAHSSARPDDAGIQMRAAAEVRVAKALVGHPVRRLVFAWVLRNARDRVRDRENLRFERTRVFGRVRRIFLEIGRRLHAAGALDAPRDVFHLELAEVLAFIDGDPTCDDLAALARVRGAEDARFAAEPEPPARIETHGPPALIDPLTPAPAATATDTDTGDAHNGDQLTGIGCCPGVVRGRARVIRDPRGIELESGDILVAERTDPGWVLLFPAASGVVVERGSLLSHSAIVARELGLPAIVSVPRLMSTLQDGETIEIDGSAGIVRRLDPPENPDEAQP